MSIMQIKVVNAGVALDWYKKSWALFKKRPGLFFLQFLLFYIIQLGTQFLGPLNTFVSHIFWCLLAVGLFYVCDKIDKGEEVHFSDFFKGFDVKTKPLIILGLYLTALLLIYAVFVFVMLVSIFGLHIIDYVNNTQAVLDYFIANIWISVFVLTLVILIPLSLLLMASIFSPALVFFHDLKPIDAIKKSLIACVHNSMVFLMHGVWFLLFSILALIPLGLGFFVLLPVVNLTIYFAYRDIFQITPTSLINS